MSRRSMLQCLPSKIRAPLSGSALPLLSLAVVLSGLAPLAAPPAAARMVELPRQLELGRDENGDPCTATRLYNDPFVTSDFAVEFSVTCRGATASRFLGIAREISRADLPQLDKAFDCGEAVDQSVPLLGTVRARRCYDRQLGIETVETRYERRGRVYSVSIVPRAQGPGEDLIRVMAHAAKPNADRARKVAAAVAYDKLAVAPMVQAGMAASAADARTSLDQGLRYIREGLYSESARVLNDALSRLPADSPAELRIELLLAAGLADSNLRSFGTARTDFDQAEALLNGNPNLPGSAQLVRKLRAYTALDLLNQRKFDNAAMALNVQAMVNGNVMEPLADPMVLRALNQSGRSGDAAADSVVATPDVDALDQLVIDTQAAWANSVALLAQKKVAESQAALAVADRTFGALRTERIDQLPLVWLQARIERQRARLLIREGKRTEALAALDKAIAGLKEAELAGSVGPTLAETQLERASVAAYSGASREDVLRQFDAAVETLISSDSSAIELPPAIEQYLDLLVADAKTNPNGTAPERFFRAIQAVGDPAIARQFVLLRSVVTADPKVAAKIKDRQDLERAINRVANDINTSSDAAKIKELEGQRAALENQLFALDAELKSNKAYDAVNDSPATIAEVRKVLQPGEAYFKLSSVRNYAFGALIDSDGVQIYRVAKPLNEVKAVGAVVRKSIDGDESSNKLPIFSVSGSYALFNLVAGPVAERMLAARSLIVDGSGPLDRLPMGVLVADRASVDSYVASRSRAPYDFSKVGFLARRLSLSTALSPRSLIVARQATPSAAPNPFIGFAQHAPVPASFQVGDQIVSVGNRCTVPMSVLANALANNPPIPARELDEAQGALGLKTAPKVIGQEFTDLAVKERTDLNSFQVLHFATHGIGEGVFGCDSPQGLLTSYGGPGSAALLSFSDIARLKLDANLVVLSACETASQISVETARAAGQEGASGSFEGLIRALLAANARAVLATYWPISNAGESEELISDFYGAARQGTIGEALKAAQTQLIVQPKSSHPYFWGAFFVVGDAEKPLLTGKAREQLAEVRRASPSATAARR